MNHASQDPLDQLLHDWAASREASEEHVQELSERIRQSCSTLCPGVADAVAAEESVIVTDGSSNSSNSFAQLSVPASQLRHRDRRDYGGKLMIGGGALLLFLILAGALIAYNLSRENHAEKPGPLIAWPAGVQPPETVPPRGLPAESFLGGSILAAKQQLLTETNAVFDDRLAWISEGEREVSLKVDDRDATESQFLLVRVVVAERTSATTDWKTVWKTDVIARNSMLVEVAAEQLDGSSLALWAHMISNHEVALEMDLAAVTDLQTPVITNTVLQSGKPTRVVCSNASGIERCIFQTVVPLYSS